MAALYYIIAREIDADPHVLFRLRGMDLGGRFGKAAVHQITPPFAVTYAAEEEPAKTNTASLDLATIPHCGELISALLPPSPPFCERDFAFAVAEFYHRCAGSQSWEQAEENEQTRAGMEHDFSRSTWTVLCPAPGPGAEAALQRRDVNGSLKRISPYEAFEHFVSFSSDDGTASYSFLFYLFKFLNLVCASCAFIPCVLAENNSLKIIWRPFETLPPIPAMLEALASRECGMLAAAKEKKSGRKKGTAGASHTVSGRSVADLLASAFLNEWVRRKFLFLRANIRKGAAGWQKGGNAEFLELLDMFFMGLNVDVSSPAQHSLPAAIDQWLSVLQIDFAANRYSLTVKAINEKASLSDNLNFAISMDVISEQEGGTKKTPLSKCKDLDVLRAPIALSNYLPEIRELASPSAPPFVPLSEKRLVAFLDSAEIGRASCRERVC
jgi:hypothetical protein